MKIKPISFLATMLETNKITVTTNISSKTKIATTPIIMDHKTIVLGKTNQITDIFTLIISWKEFNANSQTIRIISLAMDLNKISDKEDHKTISIFNFHKMTK
jgi:hypothetical protein